MNIQQMKEPTAYNEGTNSIRKNLQHTKECNAIIDQREEKTTATTTTMDEGTDDKQDSGKTP
jgi:hypothetical protein